MTTTTEVLSALSLHTRHLSTARSTSFLLGFCHWCPPVPVLPSNMCFSLFDSAARTEFTAISGLKTFHAPSVPRIRHRCLEMSMV